MSDTPILESESTVQTLNSNEPKAKRRYTKQDITKRKPRKWEVSPRDTITILEQAAKGVSANSIAKVIDRSVGTVCNILHKFEGVFTELANVKDYTQVRSPLLDAAELKLLKSMVDEGAIEKASLNNRAYAYRQIVDSNRLWKGLSTSNSSQAVTFTSAVSLPPATHNPDKPTE